MTPEIDVMPVKAKRVNGRRRPAARISDPAAVEAAERSIERFQRWLHAQGEDSYDPYDLWGTGYGVWARSVYLRWRKLGMVLTAPPQLMEIIAPRAARIGMPKHRFATAHAQLCLGFLNLHGAYGNSEYLSRAAGQAEELLALGNESPQGLSWGYPFDWRNNRGLWKAGTPMGSVIPYAFEALLHVYQFTGREVYADAAWEAARFLHEGLRVRRAGGGESAGYVPGDDSQVINISAYRAYCLIEAGWRFKRDAWFDAGVRNLEFVLQSQATDGSWLYALNDRRDAFIDNFHTCIVLKNLAKINRRLADHKVERALKRGFVYYRRNLLRDGGTPRPFARAPRLELVRTEGYDIAEGIQMGIQISPWIPEGLDEAQQWVKLAEERWQMAAGCFATRVYRGGRWHRTPYLRWPQAQFFLAMTAFLAAARRGAALPELADRLSGPAGVEVE